MFNEDGVLRGCVGVLEGKRVGDDDRVRELGDESADGRVVGYEPALDELDERDLFNDFVAYCQCA